MLATIEATGDAHLARSALSQLLGTPKAVVRLDEHARRVLWHSPPYTPLTAGVASRLRDGSAGPIGLVLASTHADGRVREGAVAQMLAESTAELVPFLVIRTGDRARAGLALLLADSPADMLPAALGIALLVERGCVAGSPEFSYWPR